MARLGLETEIVDHAVYARTVQRFREADVVLPTFAELTDPSIIPASTRAAVETVGADEPHPLNLFRVHWHND